MRHSALFRLATLVTLLVFALSCATTHLPPISAAGAEFKPLTDEKRLWDAARAEEQKLLSKATVYDDPLLTDYLDGVVARLNPPGMAENPAVSYRVTILEDPTLNAFAYPHGSLFVHTGLLARMENEDQLATVLGHEMTHVESRHLLRQQRSAQNRAIGFSIAALAAAVVLAGEEGDALEHGNYSKAAQIDLISNILVGLGLQLAFIAAINGYGRELEREADEGGMSKMAAANYDTREAEKVYQLLLDDHGDQSKTEAFFFGSHPRLAERIEAAAEWNASHPALSPPPPPAVENTAFARRMRPLVRDDAGLNIKLGRLQLAEDELTRVLALVPEDPRSQLLWGQLRLKQAEAARDAGARARFEDDARSALVEALRLDPELAAAHRELGLLSFRQNDRQSACEHFRRYLELAPKADEAPRIRDYVFELEGDGLCP